MRAAQITRIPFRATRTAKIASCIDLRPKATQYCVSFLLANGLVRPTRFAPGTFFMTEDVEH